MAPTTMPLTGLGNVLDATTACGIGRPFGCNGHDVDRDLGWLLAAVSHTWAGEVGWLVHFTPHSADLLLQPGKSARCGTQRVQMFR